MGLGGFRELPKAAVESVELYGPCDVIDIQTEAGTFIANGLVTHNCAKDAVIALEAWDVLAEEMTDGGYWPTYNMTVSSSRSSDVHECSWTESG